jgi:hypothetical protein
MIEYMKARMALDLQFWQDYWWAYVLFILGCGVYFYIKYKE